jgi:hypothetical protein
MEIHKMASVSEYVLFLYLLTVLPVNAKLTVVHLDQGIWKVQLVHVFLFVLLSLTLMVIQTQ